MIHGRAFWVVVPAYQEESLVARVLQSMPAGVDGVIVVDDASTDGTVAAILAVTDPRVELVCHERNRGVGSAIVSGYLRFMERCTADDAVCCVMAGDNQMDPRDLVALAAAMHAGADYAKGNRFGHPGARVQMPLMRWIGNVALTLGTRGATGLWHVSDSQCGYTAVTRRQLQRLSLSTLYPRYGFPNDMLLQLVLDGAVVRDVPVRAVYAEERSKIRLLKVAPRIAGLLLRGWWRRTGTSGMHGVVQRALLMLAFGSAAIGAAATNLGAAAWCVAVGCVLLGLLLDSCRGLRATCALSR